MVGAIALRTDYTASALRRLASRMRDANVARRRLSLAVVRDGASRGEAARIGGMDRQTLRDWVHRFNAAGPDGLHDQWRNGSVCRLTADQLAELSALVTTGRDCQEFRVWALDAKERVASHGPTQEARYS
ncbi:transposase [Komagataeibacter nataicola NRIC 0616]|uniref:Insertion element IS150 protein InsJ-like helix-turn-helix domain-containing protein n=1 Tax=Komagataeibacter nataicola TaxID=265960 RepID=A0ABX5P7E6_9PROT|nr:hypothetical protein CDI09_15260 [Komagataeibacter nataicola]GBR16017.1 transposase [Komagataeibacter nataicola NRIC 0616]